MAGAVWRSSAAWVVVAAIFAVLVMAALMSWSARGAKRGPGIIAHRGGAALAPENTLAAARQAIADGCDWIEIDVHESRDGEVLVIHDKDLKRVGKSELVVWETDAAELQKIDVGSWFDPKYRDERVPTLGQLLDVCQGKIGVVIELKQFHHGQRLEERVVDIVGKHDMENQVMAMSFDIGIVKKLKSLRPDWQIGWVTKEPVADPRPIVADFLAINHERATPELIRMAHRRYMPVFVWTVNDAKLVEKLAPWNPDMFITDNPVMVREVLERLATATR